MVAEVVQASFDGADSAVEMYFTSTARWWFIQ